MVSARARLDPHWWKKNCPDSLKSGAVTAVLDDFANVSKSLEKSGKYGQFFKAVGKLKSAISKDTQTLRKLKDKPGLKILASLESLAHEKAQTKQGHLTLKSGLSASGLSSTSGAKVRDVSGSKDLTTIVNGGDSKWTLVKDSKIVSSAKSRSCQALPKSIAEKDLSAWNTETVNWSCIGKSQINTPVVSLLLQLQYQWGGQHDDGGAFLTKCGLWVTDARIANGYSVEANVEVGKPANSGSRSAPIGSVPVKVIVHVTTPLDKTSKSWLITCHGNKKRDVK